MTNKFNLALLISSQKNIDLMNKYPKALYLALDYPTIIFNKNKNLHYFFDTQIKNQAIIKLPWTISQNWYRDEKGNDISNGCFSMGIALERRILFIISNILRYFFTLKYWLTKVDQIILPNNLPYIVELTTLPFKNRIKFIDERQSFSTHITNYLEERAAIKDLKVHKYSSLARLMQMSMFPNRKKIMQFPDWTYSRANNNDFIYLNSRKISNGFYFKHSNEIFKDTLNQLPNEPVFTDFITNEIKKTPLEKEEQLSLENIIKKSIINEFALNRKTLAKSYSTIKELFSSYKPSSIILPGMGGNYSIMLQLANSLGIKSYIAIDGFLTVDRNLFSKNKTGNGYLVKNYLAFGDYSIKLLKNLSKKINIYKTKPPVINIFDKHVNKTDDCYQAMILMPYPWQGNPNSKWDYRFKYICDVIECLHKININKISVKIKYKENSEEYNELKNIFKINNYKNIKILTGPLYEHIANTNNLIGTIGSAVAEAHYFDKSFFIYEPMENGLNEDEIANSIISINECARDIPSLKKNILDNNSVFLKKSDYMAGKNLEDIILCGQ